MLCKSLTWRGSAGQPHTNWLSSWPADCFALMFSMTASVTLSASSALPGADASAHLGADTAFNAWIVC